MAAASAMVTMIAALAVMGGAVGLINGVEVTAVAPMLFRCLIQRSCKDVVAAGAMAMVASAVTAEPAMQRPNYSANAPPRVAAIASRLCQASPVPLPMSQPSLFAKLASAEWHHPSVQTRMSLNSRIEWKVRPCS